MKELSLYTGIGGGLLASKYLLGWTTIGMVEHERYCQKVLKQRQEEGLLDLCPLFGDIETFINEGWAECYKGMVDVISGGVPCQAHSTAAHGRNTAKNMWEITVKCVRIIQPKFFFGENVGGVKKEIPKIRDSFASIGYSLRTPIELSCSQVGGPHNRKRIWFIAHSDSYSKSSCTFHDEMAVFKKDENVLRYGEWWENNPGSLRVDDDDTYRMDRLKALGNCQVPLQAAVAWTLLVTK